MLNNVDVSCNRIYPGDQAALTVGLMIIRAFHIERIEGPLSPEKVQCVDSTIRSVQHSIHELHSRKSIHLPSIEFVWVDDNASGIPHRTHRSTCFLFITETVLTILQELADFTIPWA
jgi:hypothetical protein